MLSCCCFCSGKFQSPRTEHLSSPTLLSSLPSEPSCLLPCILLLLLLHTASFSNLSSHHRGREHLWWPMAFSCSVPYQVSHWLHQSLLYCRWWSWYPCPCPYHSVQWVVRTSHLSLLEKCKPHLGSSASQDQTLVLAGLAFSPSSDELERSSSPGYGHFLSAPGKLLVLWMLTPDRKRFFTKM